MADVRRGRGQTLEAERARANTTRSTQERRARMAQVVRLRGGVEQQRLISDIGQAQALQSSANQTQNMVALLSGLTGVQSGKATAGKATNSASGLEAALSRIKAGRLNDTELAAKVAKVLHNRTGMQLAGMHHDGETWEKDFNFVAGNEPRKKMMKVFNALYNVFGPEGNDRLQELIFRHKAYFGNGIQHYAPNDHFNHSHAGFGA